MSKKGTVVVAGLGEVGRPLFELISQHYETVGVDLEPVGEVKPVEVLHICYPFQIADFISETVRYIERFEPALTIINSTVAIGTTRHIAERSGKAVVNSPVRGKHACMLQELKMYAKFVGAIDDTAAAKAAAHFESVGLRTKTLTSPEATELAKLTETTYFGVLIAWAQEVERYCDQTGQSYEDVVSFYEEIQYLPRVRYFPGVIGGHCVMPNVEILRALDHPGSRQFVMLEAIRASNNLKHLRKIDELGDASQNKHPVNTAVA